MKCKDCKYRLEYWDWYSRLSITATNSVRYIYCNNPKSKHCGEVIVRMDECDEAEE